MRDKHLALSMWFPPSCYNAQPGITAEAFPSLRPSKLRSVFKDRTFPPLLVDGGVFPVNHLVLIGFAMVIKPLTTMSHNPIKATLTIPRGGGGGGEEGDVIIDESMAAGHPQEPVQTA